MPYEPARRKEGAITLGKRKNAEREYIMDTNIGDMGLLETGEALGDDLGLETTDTGADGFDDFNAEPGADDLDTGAEGDGAQEDDDQEGDSSAGDQPAELTQEERTRNAHRRREAERREAMEQAMQTARDETIARLFTGQPNPITGKPILTERDFAEAQAATETLRRAKEQNISVEEMEFRQEQERRRLQDVIKNDPEYKKLTQENEVLRKQAYEGIYRKDIDEIKQQFPTAKINSIDDLGEKYFALRQAGIDNLAAFQVLNKDAVRVDAEQQAISKLKANEQASPGALGGGGDAPALNYADMPADEFEKLVQQAKAGELRGT